MKEEMIEQITALITTISDAMQKEIMNESEKFARMVPEGPVERKVSMTPEEFEIIKRMTFETVADTLEYSTQIIATWSEFAIKALQSLKE